jgi:hypothetical protein
MEVGKVHALKVLHEKVVATKVKEVPGHGRASSAASRLLGR